jgi:hypothetical protein
MDNFRWPSGDRLPLLKQLHVDLYPGYATCGSGKYFPGTKRDIMQWTQPLDCTYALLNGMYQPEIAATANVMQRWRFVQSSHQSTIVLSIGGGCETLVFARDGVYLKAPRNITGVCGCFVLWLFVLWLFVLWLFVLWLFVLLIAHTFPQHTHSHAFFCLKVPLVVTAGSRVDFGYVASILVIHVGCVLVVELPVPTLL